MLASQTATSTIIQVSDPWIGLLFSPATALVTGIVLIWITGSHHLLLHFISDTYSPWFACSYYYRSFIRGMYSFLSFASFMLNLNFPLQIGHNGLHLGFSICSNCWSYHSCIVFIIVYFGYNSSRWDPMLNRIYFARSLRGLENCMQPLAVTRSDFHGKLVQFVVQRY